MRKSPLCPDVRATGAASSALPWRGRPAGLPPSQAPPGLRGRAPTKIRVMDIERINAIGKRIADLSERTTALRGYL